MTVGLHYCIFFITSLHESGEKFRPRKRVVELEQGTTDCKIFYGIDKNNWGKSTIQSTSIPPVHKVCEFFFLEVQNKRIGLQSVTPLGL